MTVRRPKKLTRKGGGVVWELRTPDAHGRIRYRTFRTRKEADAAATQFDAARRSGATVEDRRFDELVQEFREAHLAHGLRPSSVKDVEQSLKRCEAHFGKRPLRNITPRDIEQFRNDLLRQIRSKKSGGFHALIERNRARLARLESEGVTTPRRIRRIERLRAATVALEDRVDVIDAGNASSGIRTVNKALGTMRALFNFAEGRRYAAHNPAKHAKMLRAAPRPDMPLDQNVLTPTELQALQAAIDPSWRAAVMVLAYGGLRLGELLGLQWGDVELDRGRLYVRRQLEAVTGKFTTPKTTAGTRFVELPGFVIPELRTWKLRCPRGELCFPASDGRPMDDRNFRSRVFYPALRRAGLRKIRVHDLRHTAASMMIATGEDLASISRQLGHANVNITLTTYTHWFAKRTSSGLGAKLEALVAREIGCEMVACLENNSSALPGEAQKVQRVQAVRMVARDGIEPSTRGFSVRCSTN